MTGKEGQQQRMKKWGWGLSVVLALALGDPGAAQAALEEVGAEVVQDAASEAAHSVGRQLLQTNINTTGSSWRWILGIV